MNTTDTRPLDARAIADPLSLPTHLREQFERLRADRGPNADSGTPSVRCTPLGTPCSRLWDEVRRVCDPPLWPSAPID